MFEIALHFGSYRLLVIYLAITLAGGLILARLWPAIVARHGSRAALLLLGVTLGMLLGWAMIVRMDSDEIEHLHVSWLVWQGEAPYRDFWQNHSPMLWYLLAPLVALFRSSAVVVAARVASLLLFGAIAAGAGLVAWRLSRDRGAAVLAAGLMLAAGIRTEAAWIRPDLPANLSVVLALGVLAAAAPSTRRALLGGALLSFALSLTPKAFLLVLAFPAAVLLSRELDVPEKARLLGAHFVGGLAGVAPLLAILLAKGIFSDWIHWTFVHPASRGTLSSGFPAVLAVLAGMAAFRLTREQPSLPVRVLVVALLLQTPGTVMTPYRVPVDLMLWAVVAAPLAGLLLAVWIRRAAALAEPGARAYGLLASILLVLALIDGFAPAWMAYPGGYFARDRERFDWMLREAGDGPVVLVTPLHNVYSADATGLYHLWQYNHFITDPAATAPMAGFANKVREARPRLILAYPRRVTDDPLPAARRQTLFDRLLDAGILNATEWDDLRKLIQEEYEMKEAYGELFLVRKPR